jgi:hypothetical protein
MHAWVGGRVGAALRPRPHHTPPAGGPAGTAATSLKEAFGDLREQYESGASNVHTRFTNVDMALREIERGVQV